MRIIESRQRMLESIGLGGPVFYLRNTDDNSLNEIHFMAGMTFEEFIGSSYNTCGLKNAQTSTTIDTIVNGETGGSYTPAADYLPCLNGYALIVGDFGIDANNNGSDFHQAELSDEIIEEGIYTAGPYLYIYM